ncbi:unnamed protein product [Thelazia callipaeda]|uniref:SPOC domain-containing protein n=1 Tax=Thelazia callipaeda TaxID=103827 RepID=A0A0N5CMZ3_THECL|nr:unnamed protein product [Thelazia callipaeda]
MSSLSLDDVFGTYSTDEESTKPRGSILPSLYKEKDKKDEIVKKNVKKTEELCKEKVDDNKSSNLKKERNKKLGGSDGESATDEKKKTARKVEKCRSKQIEKNEKKIVTKKRSDKGNETSRSSVDASIDLSEKKKQKTIWKKIFQEKSLVEISMFQEDEKKMAKRKSSAVSERKKKIKRTGVDEVFEKKLAKKLRREQEGKREEQRKDAAEVGVKEEPIQSDGELPKVGMTVCANRDTVSTSEFVAAKDEITEGIEKQEVAQNHGSCGMKDARKRILEVESSKEIKRSKEASKSPKANSPQADPVLRHDSEAAGNFSVEENPQKEFSQENDLADVLGSESMENDLLPCITKDTVNVPESLKVAADSSSLGMEITCVLEEHEPNSASHLRHSIVKEQLLGELYHPENPVKQGLVEPKLESDEITVDANLTALKQPFPEEAYGDLNQRNEQQLGKFDGELGKGNIGRNITRRCSTSTNSSSISDSSHSSVLSSISSAIQETYLENDSEEKKLQQIPESEQVEVPFNRASDGNRCTTRSGFMEQTEEVKVHMEKMQCPVPQVTFMPSSKAEYSGASIVHSSSMVQRQSETFVDSDKSILENVNDAESNESFELIDEGRVGDIGLLPDQDVDSDIGSSGRDHFQKSDHEGEQQVNQEPAMEVDDDGSECIDAVQMQDDVHDVQETEYAVQSIVLDDSRSQHSGEDSNAVIDYLSEGDSGTNSRHESVGNAAALMNVNSNLSIHQHVGAQDNEDAVEEGDIMQKSATDTELQDAEPEGSETVKTNLDIDDKPSDSHLDEVIDDVVAGGYMEVDAEQLMRINSKKAKEEAVLRAAAASSQQSAAPKVGSVPVFSAAAADSSQAAHNYQNALRGHSMHVTQQQQSLPPPQPQQPPPQQQHHQYGIASSYQIQHSQVPQQMQLQQSLLPQQQTQQSILHGSHVVVQQQQHMSQSVVQSQQQRHMGQAIVQQQHMGQSVVQPHINQSIVQQQQQQSNRLTSYQHSQPQMMKIPDTSYQFQPQQHLPPIEQPVQGTSAITLQQQQSTHLLQSKSIGISNLSSYYQGRNVAQQTNCTSFAPSQISLQQQQHLLVPQQPSDSIQNIMGSINVSSAHAVPQQSEMHQVVQTVPLQQQTTHLVSQSRLQQQQQQTQQQSVNYGLSTPVVTATCNASVTTAQTVASAGAASQQQLDLSKQIGLSTPSFQASVTTSSPYDLYSNLSKKSTTVASQQQVFAFLLLKMHMIQQQQLKVSPVVRLNSSSTMSSSLVGHSGPSASTTVATNAQISRPNSSSIASHQSNRVMQQQQQQLSPSHQAVAFAIGLPGTTSPFTQMQQQYLQQMYRSTFLNTFQGIYIFQFSIDQILRAYNGGNVATAAGPYGASGYSSTPNSSAAAAAAAAAATVLPSTLRQDTQRQRQQHITDLHQQQQQQQQQQQYLASSLYQQPSPTTTLCSPQQANIAAQQLNSLYGAVTATFPIPCESPLLITSQITSQPGMYHAELSQRQQDIKQPVKQKLPHQQVKTYAGLSGVSVMSRYPVMWQGIIALKTNETRVQMHKVGGNAEMCKRSLDQFTTTSNHMPLIRINQRMRMEASQLESVQCKMMDEHSYIALICLSCGPSKEDIKSQSEILKERFVDYLESKQAAGICNVGNEQNPAPSTIVHIFPPCDFASIFLQRNSPDLLEIFRQQKASYLFVVITSAN